MSFRKSRSAGRVMVVAVLLTVLVPVAAGAAADTNPPKLVGLTISPVSGNTGIGDQTITFKADLTDNLSGVAHGVYPSSPTQARFVSPSGAQFVTAIFYNNRVKGTNKGGVWKDVVTLPQYSEYGTWTLDYFYLVDQVGNEVWLTASDVKNLGLPVGFKNTPANPEDVKAPELKNLKIGTVSGNTGTGDRTIKFAARLVDKKAGVASGSYPSSPSQVSFVSPSGNQRIVAMFYNNRVSGSDQDGVWAFKATLPQYSEGGTWTLESFLVVDQLGNHEFLYAPDVSTLGLPITFDNTPATPDDKTPPKLKAFIIKNATGSIGAADQTFTFKVRMIDKPAGVAGLSYEGSPSQARFVSPSGNQDFWVVFFDAPYKGSPNDGWWVATSDLPQYSEDGVWKLDYFLVVDDLGNQKYLSKADLKALGLPVTIVVQP